MQITAIILAKNEEKRIKKALQSVSFCDEILVIDDDSTDKTKVIAEQNGATVLPHPKKGEFASQRNWAMKQAKYDWVLFIDADEEVSDELKDKIEIKTKEPLSPTTAYYIPRRDFFWGHEMKYGEVMLARNQGILRLIKKDSGTWEGSVHETFQTKMVPGILHGFINHYPHETVSEFIEDVNTYSSIRARELHEQGKKGSVAELIFLPLGKFIYTYFILAGFLDGAPGFIYSFVMSFHSFLVRAKLLTKKV